MFKGLPIKFQIGPVHLRSRPLPYALYASVEEELNKLMNQGVLERVQSSAWATKNVVSLKINGNIRICGDYKAALNKRFTRRFVSYSTDFTILTKLNEGKYFCQVRPCLSLSQLKVIEKSALA